MKFNAEELNKKRFNPRFGVHKCTIEDAHLEQMDFSGNIRDMLSLTVKFEDGESLELRKYFDPANEKVGTAIVENFLRLLNDEEKAKIITALQNMGDADLAKWNKFFAMFNGKSAVITIGKRAKNIIDDDGNLKEVEYMDLNVFNFLNKLSEYEMARNDYENHPERYYYKPKVQQDTVETGTVEDTAVQEQDNSDDTIPF